ncbi:MAG TPA: DUF3395 domain-containing protein [Terriglobales bacterium]|nr:DUF3395 domain-containing protein [Terriglobales bacterium]
MQSQSGRIKSQSCVGAVLIIILAASLCASAQSLLSATYGSGANRVDVTNRLQSLAHGGNLTVRVNNQTMGVDPAPRQPKDLRVQARDNNGQVHDYMFREGEIASLQVDYRGDFRGAYRDDDDRRGRDWDRHDRDDLVIERAFYGINNATAEVTGHLQDLVRGNSLVIRVNNETLGVDPAHDHGKVLCVFYRFRGERRAAIVRETEQLVIP